MIRGPLKAPTDSILDSQLNQLFYPVVGSAKLDGIRALPTGEIVLSASLKPIGNKYIQKCLSHPEYGGLDGELVVGSPFTTHDEDNVFWRTSGPVRRHNGEPDFKFYVFDDWDYPKKPYQWRWLDQIAESNAIANLPHVVVLEQRLLYTPQDVIDYTIECLEAEYEGAIIRSLDGFYKEGRATLREGIIFKRKPWEDDEAEIVGYYEQLENTNEQVVNNLGTHSRSSCKDGKVPKGTLGGFVLKSSKWNDTFNCGTIIGSTLAIRQDLWNNREKMLDEIVTYKYQAYGSKDKPRQPRIKGFRDKTDMTDY